jgi:hypothetical protein
MSSKPSHNPILHILTFIIIVSFLKLYTLIFRIFIILNKELVCQNNRHIIKALSNALEISRIKTQRGNKGIETYMKVLKDNGVTVIHKVAGVRYAKTAEGIGVDAVTIIGLEAGGHPGKEDIGVLYLFLRLWTR